MGSKETAVPFHYASLRFHGTHHRKAVEGGQARRDDKFEGGGPPWRGWRWMDRVKQRGSPHLPGLPACALDQLPTEECASFRRGLRRERSERLERRSHSRSRSSPQRPWLGCLGKA